MKKPKSAEEFIEEFERISSTPDLLHRRNTAIGLLKRVRREWVRQKHRSEMANDLFVIAILVRAYLDYLKLDRITKEVNWIDEHSSVESVWIMLCDLNDRLDYLSTSMRGVSLNEMGRKAADIGFSIYSRFGPGTYLSPEMLCKKVECSICGKNIKACTHIPGRLYNGVRCTEVPRNCSLRSVAIVTQPKDRRCRIWPWQLKKTEENRTISEVVILTIFKIDDFVDGNEWEKRI